jgi:hypothetical protein
VARNPQIVVEYVAKTAQLQGAAAQVGSATSRVGAAAKKAFVPAVTALGAFGVAAKKSIDQASALNEQISASQVVFGKHAKGIQSWAKTGATAFGLSTRESLSAANAYGNMFNTLGLGAGKTADMSKSMVQLAGDMASFHDQDPSEMLDALRSGLTGEAEPLKRFGVLINEASVKTFAYQNGIAKAGKELTEGQKVQARYGLIMQQTNKAQGDFARTSGSVANQQRTLAAQAENTSASFGQLLLPVMQSLQRIFGSIIGVMARYKTATTILIGVVVGLAVTVVLVNGAIAAYTAVTKVATAATKAYAIAQKALNLVMRMNPIGLVITALVLLGVALVTAYKKSETFRRIVDAAFKAVKNAAQAAWQWIKSNWPLILAVITGPIGAAAIAVIKNWDKIKAGARSAVGVLKDVWNGFASFFSGLVGRVSGIAQRVANAIKAPINAFIGGFNALGIPRVSITLPSKKILGKTIGGGSFGFGPFGFPDIPRLAGGGMVMQPTVAMIGEAGPEAVIPLGPSAAPAFEVRVFIGDTELRGMVRTEVADVNTGIARTILAGA